MAWNKHKELGGIGCSSEGGFFPSQEAKLSRATGRNQSVASIYHTLYILP
jgi:hypothetical protein